MLVSLEISMLILFPKLELPAIQRWFFSLFPANAKNRYTQNHKWRRRISTFPHVSTVPFLQFTRRNWSSHVSYPLSSPHSLPWSKPLTIVVSQSYRNLNHLSLDCLVSEPLCNSIFFSDVCALACG